MFNKLFPIPFMFSIVIEEQEFINLSNLLYFTDLSNNFVDFLFNFEVF